jgi:hypothetical protein
MARAGDRLRVRSGDVWVTQYKDPKDYLRKSGYPLTLRMLARAYQPTLLEVYRVNPLAVRERLERKARRARALVMGEWLRRIFG